jgi:hypothetical protein
VNITPKSQEMEYINITYKAYKDNIKIFIYKDNIKIFICKEVICHSHKEVIHTRK